MLRAVFLCLALSVFSAISHSAPLEHKWLNVGPYRVLLLDTKVGNRLQAGVFVPVGSEHDEPIRHAGRAHLFEHNFFAGSVKYPDPSDWNRISSRIGSHNGWTAGNHTFYYLSFHPDGLNEAFDLLGAYFSNPALNREGFQRELITVTDEAGRYQSDEGRATSNIENFYLRSEDDYRRRYSVGTKEQLDAMTAQDLAKLFYANYQPQNLVILLAGNLAQVKDQQIAELVRANFSFPTKTELEQRLEKTWGVPFELDEKPASELVFELPKQEQFIAMGQMESRSGQRALKITLSTTLEAPPTPRSMAALTVFLEYAHSKNKGSWVDFARSKGWITNVGSYVSVTNNLVEVALGLDLVDADVDAETVLSSYLDFIGKMRSGNWNLGALQRVQANYGKQVRLSMLTPSAVIQQVVQELPVAMASGSLDLSAVLDPESLYQSLTAAEIQEAAKRYLDFSSASYLEQTPVVTSGETTIFGERKFLRFTAEQKKSMQQIWDKALAGQSTFSNSIYDLKNDEPSPLVAKSKKGVQRLSRLSGQVIAPTHFLAVTETPAQPNFVGAQFSILLPPVDTVEEEVQLDLWMGTFKRAFSGTLEAIHSEGVKFNFGHTGRGLITVNYLGPADKLESALTSLVEEFKQFEPSKEDLDYVRSEYIDNQRNPERFSFRAGLNHVASHLLFGVHSKTAQRLAAEKFIAPQSANWGFWQKADFQLSTFGDLTKAAAQKIFKNLEKSVPQRLSAEERTRRQERRKPIAPSTTLWQPSDAGIDPADMVAVATIDLPWTGKELNEDPRRKATLLVLAEILKYAVNVRNREQMGLGYVHSVSLNSMAYSNGRGYFIAFGSSKKPQPEMRIQVGWRWVLRHLQEGDLFEQVGIDFEGMKTGIVRDMNLVGDTLHDQASDQLGSVIGNGLSAEALSNKAVIKQVQTIELAEVQELARQIFTPQNSTFRFFMSGEKPKSLCEDLVL